MARWGVRLLPAAAVLAVGGVLAWPAQASAAETGLQLTGTSSRSVYDQGETASLTWTLTNEGRSSCRASAAAPGSLAITSVTRNGTALPPTLGDVSYLDGLDPMIATSIVPLEPAGSLHIETVSEAGSRPAPQTAATIRSVSWSPQGLYLVDRWAVSEPGFYTVSAIYALPSIPELPADMCQGPSTAATVHFRIGRATSGPRLWSIVAMVGIVVALLVVATWAIVSRIRRRPPSGLSGTAALIIAFSALVVVGYTGRAYAEPPIVAGNPKFVDGDKAFVDAAVKCLDDFESPGGDPAGLLPTIKESIHHVLIRRPVKLNQNGGFENSTGYDDAEAASNGTGGDATVNWIPDYTDLLSGGVPADPCSSLYHELAHAVADVSGTRNTAMCGSSGMPYTEVEATLAENQYRQQHRNLPPRDYYNVVYRHSPGIEIGGPSRIKIRGSHTHELDRRVPKSLADCVLPATPPTKGCGGGCGITNGDPHLTTFDGTRYDFQAVGEFLAAKSTTDSLEIQTRQSRYLDSTEVSVNTAVAMRVATDRVGLYIARNGLAIRLNGRSVTFGPGKTQLPGGGVVYRFAAQFSEDWGDSYAVSWPDGSRASVVPFGQWGLILSVELSTQRHGRVTGLFGNFDGDGADDMATRGGQALPAAPSFNALYHTFGDSWRISQAESLFEYGPGQSTATFTDRRLPTRPVSAASLPNHNAAVAICRANGLTDPGLLVDCALDVAFTGQAAFSAVATEAQTLHITPSSTPHTIVPPVKGSLEIRIGDTVSQDHPLGAGSITDADGKNTLTFDGRQGQIVYLRSHHGGSQTWALLDPSGDQISLTSTPIGFDIGRVVLPAGGRYSVVVHGAGRYSFTLTNVPTDRSFPISFGETVNAGHPAGAGRIDSPGARHLFTFDGRKDETIHLVSHPPTNLCANFGASIYWRILDPSGNDVNSIFDNICGDVGPLQLPTNGRYTLVVQSGWSGQTTSDSSGLTGRYSFSLTND